MIKNTGCILLFLLSLNVQALVKNEVTEFSVIRTESGKVREKVFQYGELKPNFSFKAKSPHGMLNPEGKIEEWSGISIREIFTGARIKPEETKTEVIVIGTDGYFAQMELGDFFTPDAMLATHMNGNRISPSKGGPQTFFPNQDKTLPKELGFEGWGVWYVSSFIVGELPGKVSVILPSGKEKQLTLKYKTPLTKTTPKYYPPGHFRSAFSAQPIQMGFHNLEKWLKALSSEPFSKVTAVTYYGSKVPISSALSEYDLVVAWDGKQIPTKFGGPVQICKGKISQCTFFVRTLILEK